MMLYFPEHVQSNIPEKSCAWHASHVSLLLCVYCSTTRTFAQGQCIHVAVVLEEEKLPCRAQICLQVHDFYIYVQLHCTYRSTHATEYLPAAGDLA